MLSLISLTRSARTPFRKPNGVKSCYFDRVGLTAPFPDQGLEPGDFGAVVHVYPGAEAFKVEFVTLGGNTAAVVTVPTGKVRAVTKTEIPHARELLTH